MGEVQLLQAPRWDPSFEYQLRLFLYFSRPFAVLLLKI